MTTAMGYNMKIVRGELTFCGGGGGFFQEWGMSNFFAHAKNPPSCTQQGKPWTYGAIELSKQ